MKNILLLIAMLPFVLVAQVKQESTTKKSFIFQTIVQTGLLAGGSAESFTLQTVNGFRYRKWFAGLGTGLDFYMQRSIPLYADLRYDFSTKRKTFFLYSDAGVNFAWTKNKQQQNIVDQSPGLFTDAGVGLKITTKKQDALVISVGYSHKQLSETKRGFGRWSWPIWPVESPETFYRYNYKFNRIAVKLGFVF